MCNDFPPACFNNPFVQYYRYIQAWNRMWQRPPVQYYIWGKQLPVRQGYLHKWDVYGIKRIGMIYIYNIYKDMRNMYIIRVFEVQFAAYILKSSCLGERCT